MIFLGCFDILIRKQEEIQIKNIILQLCAIDED